MHRICIDGEVEVDKGKHRGRGKIIKPINIHDVDLWEAMQVEPIVKIFHDTLRAKRSDHLFINNVRHLKRTLKHGKGEKRKTEEFYEYYMNQCSRILHILLMRFS